MPKVFVIFGPGINVMQPSSFSRHGTPIRSMPLKFRQIPRIGELVSLQFPEWWASMGYVKEMRARVTEVAHFTGRRSLMDFLKIAFRPEITVILGLEPQAEGD